jgi:hypothetical protein
MRKKRTRDSRLTTCVLQSPVPLLYLQSGVTANPNVSVPLPVLGPQSRARARVRNIRNMPNHSAQAKRRGLQPIHPNL